MTKLRVSHCAPTTLTHRTAEGRSVEFEPDRDHMILYARGRDARSQVEARLADAKIHTTPWLQRTDPDQIGVLAQLPGRPDDRRQTLEALRELVDTHLPRARLVGELAAPMRVNQRVEGLTRHIVVRFRRDVTAARIAEIARAHDLTVGRPVPYAGNGHVLSAATVPDYDLTETLARLAAEPDVEYAELDIVTVATSDGPDFLLPEQHDLGVIGCPAAWAQLPGGSPAGSPAIAVAVLDLDGVDPAHPDLSGTIGDGKPKQLANHDFVAGAAQAQGALGGSHGTQCAATAVGGFDNVFGTAGVAGSCHLIAARVPDIASASERADIWLWAAGLPTGSTDPAFPPPPARGADVISIAWGSPGPLPAIQRAAIDHITSFGRGGRGCVMCFSAGNLGDVEFSAQRAAAAYERSIAVGASVNDKASQAVDRRAAYSPYGRIDLVAPSSTTVGPEPIDPIVSATRVGFGKWISAADVTTELTAQVAGAPAATTSTITVANPAGFAINQRVLVGLPGEADREFSAISAAPGPGNQLTLKPALARPHALGTPVSTGANDHDRTAGGTSHATALTAGAAALVLSARPDLTWRDVREVLRRSATRIDVGQTDATGRWIDRDGDGVAEFSSWYGYGRLNVDVAVWLARTYSSSQGTGGLLPPNEVVPGSLDSCVERLRRWRWLVAIIAAIAAGWLVWRVVRPDPTPETLSPPPEACDLPRRAGSDLCPQSGCGSNGEYLSGFVIDGLHIDGCRNYDGVRVVPGSLRRGGSQCPDVAMTLDLIDGALVARAFPSGGTVCARGALDKATFTVEGPAWALGLGTALETRTREIRIGVAEPVPALNTVGPTEILSSYTFVALDAPDQPLCKPANEWVRDFTAPVLDPEPASTGPTPAVLVIGELYHWKEARVTLRGTAAGRWFNVACRGGALAKMRRIGMDPTRSSTTAEERQATLKMITAKYCGSTSYTVDGVALLSTSLFGRTAPLDPRPPQVGPLEARWTAQGASCVSHSRVWRRGRPAPQFKDGVPDFFNEDGLLDHVRTICGIPPCTDPPDPNAGTVYWTTDTVDHISHGSLP